MVEVAAFEDEVIQEVVGVPEEQVFELGSNGLWERGPCKDLSRWHE